MRDEFKTRAQLLEDLQKLRGPCAQSREREAEPKRAEDAVWESEVMYRTIFEYTTDGISVFERFFGKLDRKLIACNDSYAKMAGRSKVELLSIRDLRELQQYDHTEEDSWMIQRKIEKGLPYEGTFSWIKPDDKENYIEYRAVPVMIGDRLFVYSIDRDVTEQKIMERKIRSSLHEKEILLKEIHHRVKNNLQLIISLLRLQAHSTDDHWVSEAFMESQGRIFAMALVHEALYQSTSLSEIDFKEYVTRLTTTLLTAYDASARGIKLDLCVEMEKTLLKIDYCVPCGLALNELISNALKHAFPEGGPGEININVRSTKRGEIELKVSDNGVGMPKKVIRQENETLGIKLVSGWIEHQLDGSIDYRINNGTHVTIRFKPDVYPERI